MSDTAPTYEDFTNGKRSGKRGATGDFIASLKVGVPQLVPPGIGGTVSPATSLNRSARELRDLKLSTRHINGELWVCLLKPEDEVKP